ncbi:uncharacterized protein VTP21DRAFT_1007 [Calcarisporiella thermophila]|uniref:uncharacterized protein n=1 Tax=Calcarisporiella thermophila TaxID=911321 RepID=UPI00374243DF
MSTPQRKRIRTISPTRSTPDSKHQRSENNTSTLKNEIKEEVPPNCWGILRSQLPGYETVYLGLKGDSESYLIGRHRECDIRINKSEVSNRHCLIYKESRKPTLLDEGSEYVLIEDLSSNGTYINGIRLGKNNRHRLQSGDKIRLAERKRGDENVETRTFLFQFPPQTVHDKDESTFAAQYELLHKLGEGNFATVRLAKHRKTGESYAVKIIEKARFWAKAKARLALQQEISILMSINHPCIIRIFGVFDEDKYLYIVLELANGGELFDYVIEKQKLSEIEAQQIFFQLFCAIKYLHDRDIAHRDLKPENVLFADRDRLKIQVSDFGLAKIVSEQSFLGTLCGTPNYVAPEVLASTHKRQYHKQVDMWSLGVILYICLCGFPPFSEELAPPPLQMQIRQGLYDMPSPYWDDISEDAKDLVRKLLTVDPNKRITVEGALEHPWTRKDFSNLRDKQSSLPAEFLQNLSREFQRSETSQQDTDFSTLYESPKVPGLDERDERKSFQPEVPLTSSELVENHTPSTSPGKITTNRAELSALPQSIIQSSVVGEKGPFASLDGSLTED